MLVIALTGQAHSGKDTSADYLVARLNALGIKTIKIGLADNLKVICQLLIKMFYGLDIPLAHFFDPIEKERIHQDLPPFAGHPFCLRTILQVVGTEVFRQRLWGSIWCDYIKHTYLHPDNGVKVVIISDCRFPDELQYFQNLYKQGCRSYRLVRPDHQMLSQNQQTHQSEVHIANLPVDREIWNRGSIADLHTQLDDIIDTIAGRPTMSTLDDPIYQMFL